MGHITRTLTYQPDVRRLALPMAYVQQHQISSGSTLWILAPTPEIRLILTTPLWSALEVVLKQLGGGRSPGGFARGPSGGDGASPSALPIALGTGNRLVLPSALAFEGTSGSLKLHWDLEGGVLVLRIPHLDASHPGISRPQRDAATPLEPERTAGGVDGSSGGRSRALLEPRPRDPLRLPGPVEDVLLERIQGYARGSEVDAPDPELEDDIAQQGILRPVVLCGPSPYRVIDGRKRLAVAYALEAKSVPGLILSPLSSQDQAKVQYLIEMHSDRWTLARQLRVLEALARSGASLDALMRLTRKRRRTLQRYLRIAREPGLLGKLERGELSLAEADRLAGGAGRLED